MAHFSSLSLPLLAKSALQSSDNPLYSTVCVQRRGRSTLEKQIDLVRYLLSTRKTYGLKGCIVTLSMVSGDYWGLEANASSLVRLKVRNARGVKVPFRENAFRSVTDRNCVIVR